MRRINVIERDAVAEAHRAHLQHPSMTNNEARQLMLALLRNNDLFNGPNLTVNQVLATMPFYNDLIIRENERRRIQQMNENIRQMRNQILQEERAFLEDADRPFLPNFARRGQQRQFRKASQKRNSARR